MKTKYTVKDFNADFKTDADCLAFVFKMRYPNGATCKCGKKDCFYPIRGRKCYCCSHCGYQISPTAGTIFHKSETPLKSWLFAMFLISNSKNGVSAMELQRQIGVTYKTAWRMAHQIRNLMQGGGGILKGFIEADETFIGGLAKNMHKGKRKVRGTGGMGKTPVIGVLERGGNVQAKVVADITSQTLLPNIMENVEKGATVCTDEWCSYNALSKAGYNHYRVAHGVREYVRNGVHTNSIEGFWSQLKRSINGTFHHVSKRHLQKYVNEFVYRYNLRQSENPIFSDLSNRVADLHA
ncbi:MAG: IS1595 family transposase [Verrucomicrobiota bacterium]|jgi:transposase-like protein